MRAWRHRTWWNKSSSIRFHTLPLTSQGEYTRNSECISCHSNMKMKFRCENYCLENNRNSYPMYFQLLIYYFRMRTDENSNEYQTFTSFSLRWTLLKCHWDRGSEAVDIFAFLRSFYFFEWANARNVYPFLRDKVWKTVKRSWWVEQKVEELTRESPMRIGQIVLWLLAFNSIIMPKTKK